MTEKYSYNNVVEKLFDFDVVLRHFCINYRKERSNKVYQCQDCPFHSDVGCFHVGVHDLTKYFRNLYEEIDAREEEYANKQGWTGDE